MPDPQNLDTGYLVHFLRTKLPHLERLARGATIKGITREVVADLPVTLPPLPEQRRIAEILDQAEALRVKRRATLAQLDTLTQSIFLDLFGYTKQFEILSLGDVAALKRAHLVVP
jgi:type I restriction enzyme S subunit